jgi:nifR3 family TIM-barrel protein
MLIGSLEFQDKALFLAPMEDITDAVYRKMIARFGGTDLMYTEFISADGLIRNGRKSLEKLLIGSDVRPIAIQIYGHLTEPVVKAAKMAEDAGADMIDLNFGCPVKKIANRGAGSGMLRNIPLMLEMTESVVKAVNKPVTVKTRLGWDDNSKIIDQIAPALQNCGIKALTIHGRTRAQMYTGQADWTLIGEVKSNPQITIPVIGNGDVDSPETASEYFGKYGVDAIMIGRACVGRPWIFKHIRHFLNTGEMLPEPSLAEKVDIAREQLQLFIEDKDEWRGIIAMRRHFVHFFKGLQDFRETRTRLLRAVKQDEIIDILQEIKERFS